MGLNFRKSFKLCKGVRVNLGKKGASITLGPRGMHYTISTSGRQTATVGLPGSGLSYSKTIKSGTKRNRKSTASKKNPSQNPKAAFSGSAAATPRSSSEMRKARQGQDALAAWRQAHPFKQVSSMQQMREQQGGQAYSAGEAAETGMLASQPLEASELQGSLASPPRETAELQGSPAEEAANYEAYIRSMRTLHTECTEVQCLQERDIDAYFAAIQETNPFEGLLEYGCDFEFGTEDASVIEAEFQAMIREIVPVEEVKLTKTGKLSRKELSKTAYYDLAQDYVCSCTIRIARELFALLPVDTVCIHVTDQRINSANGREERYTILSVRFDRETFDQIRFEYIDPSDCVCSFPHQMKFVKTAGFREVERM